MNQHLEENIVIGINNMRKIMEMFLGPFLTVYFIKISVDSVTKISIYYICSYAILAILTFVVAHIIKNKFRIGMFRIGVILNFIYILTIIILNKSMVNHLGLISVLYGVSAAAYFFPYNLFVVNKVKNSNRVNFTVKLQIISSVTGIICPIVLGSIITVTNYELTAIIVLIISLMQIILSFILTKDEKSYYPKFELLKAIKKLKNNSQIKKMLKVEFMIGMNSSGALDILKTILIFNSFKTNLNLGIITSITAIISIIFIRIYGVIYKKRNDKNIILVSSIIPILAVFVLLIHKNPVTIIIYSICYAVFTSLLSLTREIRLYNISDSYIVNKTSQCEYFAFRELILNLGRIAGFILLLLAGISGSEKFFNIVMIILTISIFVMGINLRKIRKFEK